LRQRAVALCAIVVIILGALTGDPGHSRGQEGGGSTELFAAVSFGRSRSGAPLVRRLFSAEDANPPWSFSDLVEPSPNRVDHLMLSLLPVGTPDRPLCRPMRCPSRAHAGWVDVTKIDLRAEGPLLRMTGEGHTGHSPRTSSVVSRTCEPKPTSRTSAYFFKVNALPRTVLPFLGSCPASGGASSFLPASALALHETLRSPGGQDARCVRPTSAT